MVLETGKVCGEFDGDTKWEKHTWVRMRGGEAQGWGGGGDNVKGDKGAWG